MNGSLHFSIMFTKTWNTIVDPEREHLLLSMLIVLFFMSVSNRTPHSMTMKTWNLELIRWHDNLTTNLKTSFLHLDTKFAFLLSSRRTLFDSYFWDLEKLNNFAGHSFFVKSYLWHLLFTKVSYTKCSFVIRLLGIHYSKAAYTAYSIVVRLQGMYWCYWTMNDSIL